MIVPNATRLTQSRPRPHLAKPIRCRVTHSHTPPFTHRLAVRRGSAPHEIVHIQPRTSNRSVCPSSSVEHSQSTTTFLPRTSQLRPPRSSHHARRRTYPHDLLAAQEERATELSTGVSEPSTSRISTRAGVCKASNDRPPARRKQGRRDALLQDEPGMARAVHPAARGAAHHCTYLPPPSPFPPGCVALSRGGEETQREDKNTQRRARPQSEAGSHHVRTRVLMTSNTHADAHRHPILHQARLAPRRQIHRQTTTRRLQHINSGGGDDDDGQGPARQPRPQDARHRQRHHAQVPHHQGSGGVPADGRGARPSR